MITSAYRYLSSLAEPYGLTRTLGELELCRDEGGNPIFSVGNSAVVFKIRHEGKIRKLRCYTRPKRNLRAIYRNKFLPSELFVYTDGNRGEWCDVVMEEWTEGSTLHGEIVQSLDKPTRLAELARMFDAFALGLLGEEWAHGDLKPENIIVGTDGQLHAIDFDAMFRPEFTADDCEETGTRAFQHPCRENIFGKEADDYPIAIISAALHALALDPTLYGRFESADAMMISPERAVAGSDPALEAIEKIFAGNGDAVHYRIARLLHSPQPQLFGLAELLRYAQTPVRTGAEPLRLEERRGRWGYCDSEGFVIAPLYDCGFEFSDSLAAVSIGGQWHFIDETGRVAINCAGSDAVKPFRSGRAEKIVGGVRIAIGTDGKEIG